jgi:tetratricopeptide (TPR) repeat protein
MLNRCKKPFIGMPTMNPKTKLGRPDLRAGKDLLRQAQDTIYDAWEIMDPIERAVRAGMALKIFPDCADAYVLLAEAASTPAEALEFYRKGVAAGERVLGPEAFTEDIGHFWGMLETCSYMRARAGLALSLWARGQHDEAIAHWRAMLILNPNDNQGIRYVLAARLLEAGRDRELAALLKQHQDDGRAYLAWTLALLVFRIRGDHPKSRRALAQALESNPHVPAYLLGHKPIPQEPPDYTGFGDESEAMCLAAENLKAWKSTQGALAWLAQSIVPAKPTLLN